LRDYSFAVRGCARRRRKTSVPAYDRGIKIAGSCPGIPRTGIDEGAGETKRRDGGGEAKCPRERRAGDKTWPNEIERVDGLRGSPRNPPQPPREIHGIGAPGRGVGSRARGTEGAALDRVICCRQDAPRCNPIVIRGIARGASRDAGLGRTRDPWLGGGGGCRRRRCM
jgi:hypothetical protein